MRHMRTLLTLLVVTGALAAPAAALGPHSSARYGGEEPTVLLRRSAPPPGYRGPIDVLQGTSPAPLEPVTRSNLGFKAPVASSASPHVTGTDLDWVDAGIGAGFTLGVLTVLGGVALVTRQPGRPAAA